MQFTKEHTLITKGILIIMMLMHHIFVFDLIEEYSVSLTMSDNDQFIYICVFCKLCIAAFAFLSAFGMTYSLKKESNPALYFKIVCKRVINLLSPVFFIYFLAVCYKRFILVQSIRDFYDRGDGFHAVYMFIDMLGLATLFDTPTINITWWYLTYALLLVAAMPFIYMLFEKYRYLFLLAGCLFSLTIPEDTAMFSALLPSVLLGVAFAYEGWFEKKHIFNRTIYHRIFRIIIEVGAIIFSYHLYRASSLKYCYLFAFLIPLLVYDLICYIPILSHILKFIGKHSTNIFLTHTFIYYYFYSDFIYSFKKDWLILLVMIVICILVSGCIELLKKISGYNLVVAKVISGVDAKWLL